ncbi:MAG: nuclear transport factor 2 family protein [Flavobacteriales bacterium]
MDTISKLRHTMSDTKKVEQAIVDFVKGGDNSDVDLLDQVLHADFRVTNNGYMGAAGVTVFDKKAYLEKIRSGEFGGVPREMQIEQVDRSGKIASVKLRIQSCAFDFVSYNSLVLDTDDQWKIINNLAVVEQKDEHVH